MASIDRIEERTTHERRLGGYHHPVMSDPPGALPRRTEKPTAAATTPADLGGVRGGPHTAAVLDRPATPPARRPLVIALGITTTFLIVEIVGSLATNSLALLADAMHMLTDVAAIALALFAIWIAGRRAGPERTFGYLRAEILAASVNAVSLIVIAIYIFWEAWQRLRDPPEVQGRLMLVVAVAGLAANGAAAWVLSRGGGHRENLNTRGAFLHVIGDMLGSVAAILAALIISLTGWNAADPILSAVIGGLVVFSAFSLLRESVDILLESAPPGLILADVERAMRETPNVVGVHDLHVWTVTSGLPALAAHVETRDPGAWSQTLDALETTLRDTFGIAHVTLQPEPPGGAAPAETGGRS